MKKLICLATALFSSALLAQTPQFENLEKSDLRHIAREFSGNFAHTTVSAPETEGVWGIEVGLVAGKSGSPKLADIVDDSGGDGSDFKNLYHAGAIARAHFPFDLFAEINLLPERDFDEVTIKNTSFEVGWNAGAFFSLPLDLAVGISFANSEISFTQDPTTSVPVKSEISLESKTRVIWVGASKTFAFFTPYAKIGTVKSESDIKADADIFAFPLPSQEYSVDNSGSLYALGANFQFLFFKFGAEISQIMQVKRASAKISFDF